MVFEDIECTSHFPGVEDIDVVVFVRYCKVEGFHRVPGDGVRGEGQSGFRKGRLGSQVVEHNGAVGGARGEKGGFSLVERDRRDCVGRGGPVEDLKRCRRGAL